MKYLVFLLSFLILAQEKIPDENLPITIGITARKKLKFDPGSVDVGNPDLLQIRVNRNTKEVTFNALKTGTTSVDIRDASTNEPRIRYIVTVTADSLSNKVLELKDLIGDIEGINIGIKANKVVVDGQIIVPKDIGRMLEVLDRYQDVLVLVEPSPSTLEIIAQKMQEEIRRNDMRNVTVRVVNDIFLLEGVVDSEGKKERALQIATIFYSNTLASLAEQRNALKRPKKNEQIVNFIVANSKSSPTPPPKLIKIVAQFVELSKDYSKTFGINWSPTLQGGGGRIAFGKNPLGEFTTESEGTLSGIIANLFPKLGSAKNAGHARVMQSAMLVTENKTKGSISKNTNVPISVGTGEFSKPLTLTIGMNLNVTPEILTDELIKLKGLNISVSLSGGQTATISNSISVDMVVNSKESAVIGGITFNQSSTSFDKPGEASSEETPDYLFQFIRSKDYNTSKSQFVIFVTPEIMESASQDVDDIKRKFRRRKR